MEWRWTGAGVELVPGTGQHVPGPGYRSWAPGAAPGYYGGYPAPQQPQPQQHASGYAAAHRPATAWAPPVGAAQATQAASSVFVNGLGDMDDMFAHALFKACTAADVPCRWSRAQSGKGPLGFGTCRYGSADAAQRAHRLLDGLVVHDLKLAVGQPDASLAAGEEGEAQLPAHERPPLWQQYVEQGDEAARTRIDEVVRHCAAARGAAGAPPRSREEAEERPAASQAAVHAPPAEPQPHGRSSPKESKWDLRAAPTDERPRPLSLHPAPADVLAKLSPAVRSKFHGRLGAQPSVEMGQKPTVRRTPQKQEGASQPAAAVRDIFAMFDTNGDGFLSQGNYSRFCRATEQRSCDTVRFQEHCASLGAVRDDQFGTNLVLSLAQFAQLYTDKRFTGHFEREGRDLRQAKEHFGQKRKEDKAERPREISPAVSSAPVTVKVKSEHARVKPERLEVVVPAPRVLPAPAAAASTDAPTVQESPDERPLPASTTAAAHAPESRDDEQQLPTLKELLSKCKASECAGEDILANMMEQEFDNVAELLAAQLTGEDLKDLGLTMMAKRKRVLRELANLARRFGPAVPTVATTTVAHVPVVVLLPAPLAMTSPARVVRSAGAAVSRPTQPVNHPGRQSSKALVIPRPCPGLSLPLVDDGDDSDDDAPLTIPSRPAASPSAKKRKRSKAARSPPAAEKPDTQKKKQHKKTKATPPRTLPPADPAPVAQRVVRGVTNSRPNPSGQGTQYKVRWKGCDKSDDSWVGEGLVAANHIATFEAKKASKQQKQPAPAHHPKETAATEPHSDSDSEENMALLAVRVSPYKSDAQLQAEAAARVETKRKRGQEQASISDDRDEEEELIVSDVESVVAAEESSDESSDDDVPYRAPTRLVRRKS